MGAAAYASPSRAAKHQYEHNSNLGEVECNRNKMINKILLFRLCLIHTLSYIARRVYLDCWYSMAARNGAFSSLVNIYVWVGCEQ